MGQLDAPIGRIAIVTSLPQTPEAYYGASSTLKDDEWRGGELVYIAGTSTGGQKLYIQTATSGRTPTWRTIATQFATG